MAKGALDDLYVSLSLDMAQFDRDLAAADAKIESAVKQLGKSGRLDKLRMEVDQAGFADAGNNVAAITNKMQHLSGIIINQREKVNALGIAYTETAKRLGSNSAESQRLEGRYLQEQLALRNLLQDYQRARVARIELEKAPSTVMWENFTKNIGLYTAAAVASVAALAAQTLRLGVAWGQAVNDIEDMTGMNSQSASRLLGVGRIVGIQNEEMVGLLAKLARTVGTANKARADSVDGKPADDVFSRYNIAITDANGSLLDYEAIMQNIIEVHRSMADGIEKTSMEMDIFGKSGYKVNDLLNLSNKTYQEYRDTVDAIGATLRDSSQKYEDFNRQVNTAKLAIDGTAATIAGDMVPQMENVAGITIDAAKAFNSLSKEMRNAVYFGMFEGMTANPLLLVPGKIAEIILLYKELQKVSSQPVNAPDASAQLAKVDAAKRAADLKAEISAAEQKKSIDLEILRISGTTAEVQRAELQKHLEDMKKAGASQLDIWRLQAEKETEIKRQQGLMQLQIMTDVFGTELEKQLLAIDMKAEAYKKAGFSELETTRLIEQQKSELIKKYAEQAAAATRSAFMGAYGSVVGEVQQAILEGKDGSAALSKAMDKYNKRRDAERQAIDLVGSAVGVRDTSILQAPDPMIEIKRQMDKYYEAKYASSQREYPEDKVRGGMQQNKDPRFNPQGGDKVIPGQNLSLSMPISVNVNGMDATSAMQLGEIAAQQIIPKVEVAIGNAATQYGRNTV